jgi:hypothetical protein
MGSIFLRVEAEFRSESATLMLVITPRAGEAISPLDDRTCSLNVGGFALVVHFESQRPDNI